MRGEGGHELAEGDLGGAHAACWCSCPVVRYGGAQLVDEAYQRWLTEEEGVVDDITAVVVRFIHPKQQ